MWPVGTTGDEAAGGGPWGLDYERPWLPCEGVVLSSEGDREPLRMLPNIFKTCGIIRGNHFGGGGGGNFLDTANDPSVV